MLSCQSNLLKRSIYCRNIFQSCVPISNPLRIDSPHRTWIEIYQQDIVIVVSISDKLIVYSILIIDLIFRNILPENIPSDRISPMISDKRYLTGMLIEEVFAEILDTRTSKRSLWLHPENFREFLFECRTWLLNDLLRYLFLRFIFLLLFLLSANLYWDGLLLLLQGCGWG